MYKKNDRSNSIEVILENEIAEDNESYLGR